jgi:hypothetical protein
MLIRILLGLLGTHAASTIAFQAYVGNYRLAPDHILAIAEWEVDPEAPHLLVFTDLQTGRIGVLSEAGDRGRPSACRRSEAAYDFPRRLDRMNPRNALARLPVVL